MELIFTGSQFGKSADLNIPSDQVVMLVDLDRCIRCGTCQLACSLEFGENGRLAKVRNLHPGEKTQGSRQVFTLPGACRQCPTPCMYYDIHNFWIRCPEEKFAAKVQEPACDLCLSRREAGYWPACATRCPMKTIYVGTMEDINITLRDKRFRSFGDLIVRGPHDLTQD